MPDPSAEKQERGYICHPWYVERQQITRALGCEGPGAILVTPHVRILSIGIINKSFIHFPDENESFNPQLFQPTRYQVE